MYLYEELNNLDRPIRIALIGAGFMGQGIAEVVSSTPGMELVAISDKDIKRAEAAFESAGNSNPKYCGSKRDLELVDFNREKVVTENYNFIFEIQGIDIIVEATGIPEIGTEVAYKSILENINIATLTVETDVTAGYILTKLSKTSGVVYTVCTGDEPAALREMYDFFKTLGFEIISCGKGKNNPLDNHATPETLEKTAKSKGLNPRILTEFVDGSKTMIEMSSVANSCGLTIDRRNMHGPAVDIDRIASILCHKSDGGILTKIGVVDYVVGDLAPGVFVVARHKGKVVDETLRYLKIGNGPNYLFYRPYHLTSIEVPISIAYAVLYGKPSLNTSTAPTTEVITISKKDLKKGDSIDGIGGFTVYGGIETASKARELNLLPLGLSEGAILKKDIQVDTPIRYDDVEIRESTLSILRKLQDKMYG